MKNFYDQISLTLQEIAKSIYNLSLESPIWEYSSRQEFGDLSSAAPLKIASQTNNDPLEVAAVIKRELVEKIGDSVEKLEIVKPGFINLFFSKKILINTLDGIINQGKKYFREANGKKLLIEFVSANPTGPLSIAHGRQAVVGDVLANIRAALGDSVEREYYLNDIGRQIDLLVLSVQERIKELEGKKWVIPEGGYKGEYVKEIADSYLKEGKGQSLGDFCLSYMESLIKNDLGRIGISFNNWVSQKKLVEDKKVEEAIRILKERGFIYEQEGALWFRSTKFSDSKDRVIKKSDGSLTYFASDIAYHYDKCQRNYGRLINLWGPDHHGYIKRIYSALEALGCKNDLLRVVIVQLVTLRSKERMSKRAGTMVCLSELIKEVGEDATRFYYLTRKNSSHLDFDIDLAKKSSFDNPLYYIQYVCARIESIFKKAGKLPDGNFNQYIESEEELQIVRFLAQFPFCLQRSYFLLEPVFIVEYLKNLASLFHKFYENVRVLCQDSDKSMARLNILQATKIVLHFGLEILGIKPVEQM